MKKIFLFVLCFASLISCEKDSEIEGGLKESTFFKITEFKISENSIDLNNDNIPNSNMLLEFLSYFNNTYDLQIQKNNNSSLISFYIPHQNIFYDYVCCPNGYVEFSKNGFTINQDKNETTLENQVIENGIKIISFVKTDNSSYNLILEKKYYDFSLNTESSNVYEIKYEIIN